jgi:alcohol dehydrogenase (cytochrome c)
MRGRSRHSWWLAPALGAKPGQRPYRLLFSALIVAFSMSLALKAVDRAFVPVTDAMLRKPDPGDWLMWGRTYNWQHFSPLDQVNRENVHRLQLAWSRGMRPGPNQNSPLVYKGVMYLVHANNVVTALDATNGDLIWEYRRELPEDVGKYPLNEMGNRTRSLSIYNDKLYLLTQDAFVVALDAQTGKVKWETKTADYKTGVTHSSAPAVVNGKVISGRTCGWSTRCFIAAHDAETGKEVWRFWTAALPGTPEDATWGGLPLEKRGHVSPWGAPGSFDPETGLYYVGTAVPGPYPRIARHDGNPDAVPRGTPSELYSNSTLAINPDTGKLAWYFQHLPGDDHDSDVVQERMLIDTTVNPNPQFIDWINPAVLGKPEQRKIVVTLGEPGGLWALDRTTGKFLWGSAFPAMVPEYHLSSVDPKTGQAFINWDLVHKAWHTKVVLCYQNTKGWYNMSYSPVTNYLYIPWNDNCLEQTSNPDRPDGTGPRHGIPRPGADPDKMGNLTALDVSTGKQVWRIAQRAQTAGGTLGTASNLVFWGDQNRRFRAMDAETGKVLWETMLGDSISNGPITYMVNGREYVAQVVGNSGVAGGNIGANGIYVFALPKE